MTTKIVRSQGLNRSEQILAALCDRAFLRLWCYPNTHRSPGKELADVLVVFGDDTIIFSDKACAYPNTGNVELDWQRWKRRSIEDSVRQLVRAENWIKQQTSRVFLDAKCTIPIPIKINPKGRFHKIVVARNVSEPSRKFFGSGSGSLPIFGPTVPHPTDIQPFRIYMSEFNGGFFHVLDDVTLPIVLRELDTAADFVDYLTKKEAAFSTGRYVSSAGEEETLAIFLASRSFGSPERELPSLPEGYSGIITEGHWKAFAGQPEKVAKVIADKVSYFWDNFLNALGDGLHAGDAPNPLGLPFEDLETIARFMASETRLQRRFFSASMLSRINEAKPNEVVLRRCISSAKPRVAYAFCFMPLPSEGLTQAARDFRREYLAAYCGHTLRILPDLETVVGIASESTQPLIRSFDFLLVDQHEFSPEEAAVIDEYRNEYNWLSDEASMQWQPAWSPEFPFVQKRHQDSQTLEKQMRKRKRQDQKASRRKNRRR